VRKVLVVQPYIAAYRKPFWDRTIPALEAHQIVCDVAAGMPIGDQAVRGDSASIPNLKETQTRSVRVGAATLRAQGSWKYWSHYDGLILEASGSLLDTTLALLQRRRPVGLWGHIASYTGPGNRLDLSLERWQLSRASSVLAYTADGAETARRAGVSSDRIVVLNNTIDTSDIGAALAGMTTEQAHEMLGSAFDAQRTFSFIGGLDSSKRVGFLADVMDRVWSIDPRVKLIVGGDGEDASILDEAVSRGQVLRIGRAGPIEKAAMARCSTALLMPGRVGLVAVDSLALGLPLVTTDWPFHAPEFSYLRPGHDSLVTPDSVDAYASELLRLSNDPRFAASLRVEATARAGWPALTDMVESFIQGVELLWRESRP
jgi:glycosyltransferase involved in cell wall biosynthesis